MADIATTISLADVGRPGLFAVATSRLSGRLGSRGGLGLRSRLRGRFAGFRRLLCLLLGLQLGQTVVAGVQDLTNLILVHAAEQLLPLVLRQGQQGFGGDGARDGLGLLAGQLGHILADAIFVLGNNVLARSLGGDNVHDLDLTFDDVVAVDVVVDRQNVEAMLLGQRLPVLDDLLDRDGGLALFHGVEHDSIVAIIGSAGIGERALSGLRGLLLSRSRGCGRGGSGSHRGFTGRLRDDSLLRVIDVVGSLLRALSAGVGNRVSFASKKR